MPSTFISSRHAIPAAPAPSTTIVMSEILRPVMWAALMRPAAEIIAVPCWSSWNTGMSISSLSFCSIMKHSGAPISSRLIPPQDGPRYFTALMNSSVLRVSTSISTLSMSAKRLNRTALPSITGLEASAPKLPRPSTAVPFEITATRLPFAV